MKYLIFLLLLNSCKSELITVYTPVDIIYLQGRHVSTESGVIDTILPSRAKAVLFYEDYSADLANYILPFIHNPKRYEVLDSYDCPCGDGELESIDAHYMSMDGNPFAYGHILIDDEEGSEFGVDIYKDFGGLYLYEWSPIDGHETKRYLTKEQRQWVIAL